MVNEDECSETALTVTATVTEVISIVFLQSESDRWHKQQHTSTMITTERGKLNYIVSEKKTKSVTRLMVVTS